MTAKSEKEGRTASESVYAIAGLATATVLGAITFVTTISAAPLAAASAVATAIAVYALIHSLRRPRE